ncbi:hydroxyectoine utilization dehydratase EutB [Siminovitchia fortis]|uniref:threonine ammonia-lyase n=1 Tax=Siminovitchia fortis TaxID=254758 RepID=A0A443IV69_9BACI|nr:hydroxyectoine utilization dehydratase EutB [Siminovitchia fortis]RWR11971.1 hydroxyectoine utilization dehydratase EutB [Siminovitchia fortis]WHY80766.1 hydroxyectoine utilization dehydratase EutB [Siminovitchia fortis]
MNKVQYVPQVEGLSLQDVFKARKKVYQIVKPTPFIHSIPLSEHSSSSIFIKLENFHEIGAFKVRGAANKILNLSNEEKKRGVATFSTGNHGLAVAYVAKKLGIEAAVCISPRVPKAKVDAIRRAGAKIEIVGNSQDDAEKYCYELEEKHGLTVIKPFDDADIISGQGTIGLEMAEEVPDLEAVVVPLSGGGLFAGVALALKSYNPSIQVIGVSMERSPVMYESIKAGKPVVLEEQPTLADSLLGGIGLNNEYTFECVKQYADDLVLVSEEEIAEAMGFMAGEHRMIVEGAAATGVAAILTKRLKSEFAKIGTIITGNNVDLSVISKIMQDYEFQRQK